MSKSAIPWTESVWNPIIGCTPASAGCRNCYAARMAWRFSGPGQVFEGAAVKTEAGEIRWSGDISLKSHKLQDPVKRKTPTVWFVNPMSDLFHDDVPDAWLAQIFEVIEACPRHTFQILTKRPKRANLWVRKVRGRPLPSNVWLGISAENQETAAERLYWLLDMQVNAFASLEPMLGPIDLTDLYPQRFQPVLPDEHNHSPYMAINGLNGLLSGGANQMNALGWVIVGGESGPSSRPFNARWARDVREQCARAGVPFFFKQHGAQPIEWVVPGEEQRLDGLLLQAIPIWDQTKPLPIRGEVWRDINGIKVVFWKALMDPEWGYLAIFHTMGSGEFRSASLEAFMDGRFQRVTDGGQADV